MDEKTLEYMGERVDEGRAIKKRIKSLVEDARYLSEMSEVESITFGRNIYLKSRIYTYGMLMEIRNKAIVVIENEIRELESRFDEL